MMDVGTVLAMIGDTGPAQENGGTDAVTGVGREIAVTATATGETETEMDGE